MANRISKWFTSPTFWANIHYVYVPALDLIYTTFCFHTAFHKAEAGGEWWSDQIKDLGEGDKSRISDCVRGDRREACQGPARRDGERRNLMSCTAQSLCLYNQFQVLVTQHLLWFTPNKNTSVAYKTKLSVPHLFCHPQTVTHIVGHLKENVPKLALKLIIQITARVIQDDR